MQQQATKCAFNDSNSWVVLSPIEQSIRRKIEAVGTPLKDWDIQINYGIKTGCNEAFIISTEKREEILASCADEDERKRTAEIIRPILRGRDIKRYSYNWAGLYLIATFPARHYDIEQYPALADWLINGDWVLKSTKSAPQGSPIGSGLKRLGQLGMKYNIDGYSFTSRKRTNNYWFEVQDSISYWEDFERPKIIYPNMTKYMPFVYDEDNYVTNQKCFIITGEHISYLAAILNSSLFKFCFRNAFPELQGGTRELSKVFFDKIPVLKVSDETNSCFRKAVQDIQQEYSKSKAIAIDKMIFDLYDLTDEERKNIGFIEIR